MNTLTFIRDHWSDILIAIGVLITAILGFKKELEKYRAMSNEEKEAYVKRLLENLIPVAVYLTTVAESIFGAKTGELKRAYVIDELYSRIPDEFKPYVSEANLSVVLEKALESAQTFWESHDMTQVTSAILEQEASE